MATGVTCVVCVDCGKSAAKGTDDVCRCRENQISWKHQIVTTARTKEQNALVRGSVHANKDGCFSLSAEVPSKIYEQHTCTDNGRNQCKHDGDHSLVLKLVEKINCWDNFRPSTFLSAYHPQKITIAEPIIPPGVERIRVCFDLGEMLLVRSKDSTVYARISEAFDDDITDCGQELNFHWDNFCWCDLQLLKAPLGILATKSASAASRADSSKRFYSISLTKQQAMCEDPRGLRWPGPSWISCFPYLLDRSGHVQEQQSAPPSSAWKHWLGNLVARSRRLCQ